MKKTVALLFFFSLHPPGHCQLKHPSDSCLFYKDLSRQFKQKNDYKKAYEYLARYSTLRDTLLREEKNKSIAEMQTRFDTDKKEKEIILLTKSKNIEELQSAGQQANIKKQKVTIYASLGGITLALIWTLSIVRGNAQKRKANNLLEEKNEAIATQKNILVEKNTLITDSIEYAKSMLDAILPEQEIMDNSFPQCFILFKPKEVVGGDFYWLYKPGPVFFAVIDCTVDGVAGAFMALHAHNLLEQIVKEKHNATPAEILNALDLRVRRTLHRQNETATHEHKIKMAMIKIDPPGKTNEGSVKMMFSGAYSSLVIVHPQKEKERSLAVIDPDPMFVGNATSNFTNHQVTVSKNAMLYLSTNGYADQKGGPGGKTSFSGKLQELLEEIAPFPAEKQKTILENTHRDWKDKLPQEDDILVTGIRL